jgi:O-antigen biosynthesis protein
MDHSIVPAEDHTPLVSIVLLAYNHLDYTKLCVESLFRYTTNVDYELITVDNGSSDGTREFFESLPNTKKLSFQENIGVDKAVNCGLRAAEGKYSLNLSNDIVVTANWLSNLVACIQSDERIAMVVPVCGASSNNQQVRLPYDSQEQMQQIAQVYNQSNPLLWEERLKLVTYTCLFRSDALQAVGYFDEDFNPGAYDDDAISFQLRRMGYKLILATDTYVHHYGSVTFNAEYTKNDIATRNFNLFIRKFGINSWAACMIDFNVTGIVDYEQKNKINILGTGRSCGSTLLQIKNLLRKKGVLDVSIDYFSEQEGNLPDLKTICRDCVYDPAHPVTHAFGGREYALIVAENETDKLADVGSFYENISDLLAPHGQLITTAVPAQFPIIAEAMRKRGLTVSRSLRDYYYSFKSPS